MLYGSLDSHGIINDGKILSSVTDFIEKNRDKLNIPNLTDERYQEILKILADNRNAIKDGNKKTKKVKIRENKWQTFKVLWETINKNSKIVYRNIEEKDIIQNVSEVFNKEKIPTIKNKIYTQKYNAQNDEIENLEEITQGETHFFQTQKFDEWINFFVKEQKFSFPFMLKLLNNIDKQKIKNNPQKAKERLLEILKETIHGSLLTCVDYQFLETSIYPNKLQNGKGQKKQEIAYGILGKDYMEKKVPENLLYDTICFDSIIEKEIQLNDPQSFDNNKVTVFAKLPKISIPTPYKNYNPDFAYLIEKPNGKKLFLVVETKGYESEAYIPAEEQQKIKYAKKFFKALQKQLPTIEIQYKTRINAQSLSDILQNN
jgi:type III restriction enzyme